MGTSLRQNRLRGSGSRRFARNDGEILLLVIAREGGRPGTPRHFSAKAPASLEYWIVRSSRTMTAE